MFREMFWFFLKMLPREVMGSTRGCSVRVLSNMDQFIFARVFRVLKKGLQRDLVVKIVLVGQFYEKSISVMQKNYLGCVCYLLAEKWCEW